MISNQRSPLWPFLLVLGGLFVLSLAVPRGWKSDPAPAPSASHPAIAPGIDRSAKKTIPPVAIVRPDPQPATPPPVADRVTDAMSIGPGFGAEHSLPLSAVQPPSMGIVPQPAFPGAWTETVAEKIAELRRFGQWRNLLPAGDRPMWRSAQSHADIDSSGRVDDRDDRATADEPAFESEPHRGVDAGELAGKPGQWLSDDTLANCYWPVPRSLLEQLDTLLKYPEFSDWATVVQQTCVELCHTSPGDPPRAATIVKQLQSLLAATDALAAGAQSPQAAVQLRRVRYALERRLTLWETTLAAPQQGGVFANVGTGHDERQRLKAAVAAVDARVATIPFGNDWRKYFLLDELAQLADSDASPSGVGSRRLAQQALIRLSPHQATETQRQILHDPAVQALAERLRPWAAEAVDVRDVLASLERYESSGLPSDARRITTAQRHLNWSPSEQDRQLADRLDMHYRNANVRMALTAELLNRLVPEPPTTAGVVSDTVLGTPVTGYSETTARLTIKVVPDPHRLHLWFEVQGHIDSRTRSNAGMVTFRNIGESNYVVRKAVIVDEKGLGIANATTEAKSDSQLIGVRTDLDGVPLLGPLARNMARSQHDARRGEALAEVRQKIAAQVGRGVDGEIEQRLYRAEQRIRKDVLAPLEKLGLDPEPISLESSAQRIVMRMRVAGHNQLGGHTARPQAPSDSLASAQIHESALNNALDRLQLAGRTFALPDLFKHLAERSSQPEVKLPDDLPEDVTITFAKSDPVRVRCQDGIVRLTMAVDQLRQGSRQWRDFLITANYAPEVDGLHAKLARQGSIELGGETYRGRPEVLLRGIFSRVLSRERTIDLVPPLVADDARLADLGVSQCVIEDGWLGLALAPDRTIDRGNQARRPTEVQQR